MTQASLRSTDGSRDFEFPIADRESGKRHSLSAFPKFAIRNPQFEISAPKYPKIAADYAYTFGLLKSLKCDVFLGPHGSFFAMNEKMALLERGAKANPFIDPQGYKEFIERTERAYLQQLKQEQPRKYS